MTPAAFARALAACLAPVLPAGFAVRAEGDTIHVDAPDSAGASTSLAHLDPAEAEAEDYADAAWNVLSMVQDVVSETAIEPWPAAMGAGDDLPDPGTRVEGRSVHLFFGAEEQPVLNLPAITLE